MFVVPLRTLGGLSLWSHTIIHNHPYGPSFHPHANSIANRTVRHFNRVTLSEYVISTISVMLETATFNSMAAPRHRYTADLVSANAFVTGILGFEFVLKQITCNIYAPNGTSGTFAPQEMLVDPPLMARLACSVEYSGTIVALVNRSPGEHLVVDIARLSFFFYFCVSIVFSHSFKGSGCWISRRVQLATRSTRICVCPRDILSGGIQQGSCGRVAHVFDPQNRRSYRKRPCRGAQVQRLRL